jgi:hypothetical protein
VPNETGQLPARSERVASARLGIWSRVGAVVIGLAGLGSGGVAVFVTHLEAGPVGLLAVGFLLLVVGMSGRLPSRLKLGDNEAEWQEEREAFAEFVEQVAVAAPGIGGADLIGALDKLAQAAPEVANPALSAMAYEALVMETLSGLARRPLGGAQAARFNLIDRPGRQGGLDAILEAAGGVSVGVEIGAARPTIQVLKTIRHRYSIFCSLKEKQSDLRVLIYITRAQHFENVLDVVRREYGPDLYLVELQDAKDAESLKVAIADAFSVARSIAHKE